MFDAIVRRFVVKYIKKSMSHTYKQDRDAIFKAVNDGMREEFNEDNVYTRIYSTVSWLVQQDTEFITHTDFTGDEFVDTVAINVRNAVLDGWYEVYPDKFVL